MEQTQKVKAFMEAWIETNKAEFFEAADQIWAHPELSMQEHKSCAVLTGLLERHGFAVEKGVAGMPTAFVATYGGAGPVVALNVEYDALPGLSQRRDVAEKSPVIPGAPGQGCGHNLLGSAAVLAGVALRRALEHFGLSGTVKLLGAPAEELCLGKPFLGKAGLLGGIDAFLDWHPWNCNRADYDACSAYFSVKYHFKGKTSHGNAPWNGRSTLDAAMLQAHAVELLREHIYPGCPPDAANTINYTFPDVGPEFANVVPDRTTAWYIGRFVTSEEGQDALRRITNCAKAGALATETQVEVELITATNHKLPNKVLAQVMHENFKAVGPPAFTPEEQAAARELQRAMEVEETGLATGLSPFGGGYSILCDTSEYSWNAPYATAWVALAPDNIGWHNWGVALCAAGSAGKKSLCTASRVMAATGADLFCDPSIIERAKEELRERTGGKPYTCLLPADMTPPVDLNRDTMQRYQMDAAPSDAALLGV